MSILRFMKKLFLFVAVMITAVSFSSCSKDDDNGNSTPREMRYVKEIRSTDYRNRSNYCKFEYDQQHRITKCYTNTEDGQTITYSFVYNGNTVQVTANSSASDESFPYAQVDLNNNGLATTYTPQGYGDTYTYEYDATGGLTKEQSSSGYTVTYRWENGNRYEASNSENSPSDVYTEVYTSRATPPCNLNFSGRDIPCRMDGILNVGSFFLGKQNANLLEYAESTETGTSYLEGYRYSHEFNQEGYISRIKETWYYAGEDDEVTTYDITYY